MSEQLLTVPNVGLVPVTALPRPFSDHRVDVELPAGLTLAEMVEIVVADPVLRRYAVVDFEGRVYPTVALPHIRPKAGKRVKVLIIPGFSSGGSGGGQKNTWAVVASMVVIVAAMALTYGGAGPVIGGALGFTGAAAGFAGAAVISVGSIAALMAINALLPPPRPKLRELGGDPRTSPSIIGTRNEVRKFGVTPRVLGRIRLFPPKAALDFTEIRGGDQYVHVLLDLGDGPLRLSQLKIGETPFANFPSLEWAVRMAEVLDDPSKTNLTDGPTPFYTNDVGEDPHNIDLTEGLPESETQQIGPWHVRRSRLDADRLSVDVTFGTGVGKIDKGEREQRTGSFRIRYALAGTQNWIDLGVFSRTDTLSVQPLRHGHAWDVAPGQYDVGLRNEGPVGRGTNPQEALFCQPIWSMLRTIRNVEPILEPGHTRLDLFIKATDVAAGIIDTVNCFAESILPDWDPPSQTWITRVTNNPASLVREVLQGRANEEPAEDDDLDLVQFQHFHEWNTANAFTCNMVADFESTAKELLFDICAAGRAMPTLRDGCKASIIIDEPQSIHRAHFDSRNAWGFTLDRAFFERPDAFRILFPSEEIGFETGERLVFADGFDENTAKRYAELQLVGATNGGHVFKLGRYRHAELVHRRETFTFFTDWRYLGLVRGDLASLSYDVIEVGLGGGRVASLVTSGPNTTGIVLDDVVVMEVGKVYSIQVQREDGLSEQFHTITTAPGETPTLTLATPVATGSGPQIGNHVAFGEAGKIALDILVRGITPGPDITAKLVGVPYHAGVYSADTEAIPPYDPKLTRPPVITATPPQPVVDFILSDETVLLRGVDGTLQSQIVVSFHFRSGSFVPAAYIEARLRESGTDTPWRQFRSQVSGDASSITLQPVEQGRSYDIQLRSISATGGAGSEWLPLQPHVVIGKTSPPPNVTVLSIDLNNVLMWRYPSPPPDLAGFLVRRHFGERTTWSDAEPIHDGIIGGTQFPVPIRPLGLVTYLVKAVDTSGIESEQAVALSIDLGTIPIENVLVIEDLRAQGFPGEVIGGEVVAGDLVALSTTKVWSGDDNKPAWTGQDGAAAWTGQYAAGIYRFSVLPPANAVPSDLTLDYRIAGPPFQIQHASSGLKRAWSGIDATPAWSGNDATKVWSGPAAISDEGWLPWLGELESVPQQVFEFRITLQGGPVPWKIARLLAKFDVPDLVEIRDEIAIAAGGTRIPLVTPFRQITRVEPVLKAGGPAKTVKVADHDVLGPLIRTEADGVGVADTLDSVTIRGF